MEPTPVTAQRRTVGPEKDLTGRSRLVSNVLFSWGAQLVFIVAGFLMPRMIDQKLGQEILGVWDFSWSVVTYFRLIELGITSSVNRHVAQYWGRQDLAGVNRVVSSASCALFVAASLVLLATVAAVVLLPVWFGERLNEHLSVARMSVLYLGCLMTIGTALGAFNGVLTGCHRWELQSLRLSFWHFVTVAGMLVALWAGAGLEVLAAITCLGQTLGQLTMVTLAFKVCPGLRVKRSFVEWATIKQLYVYSGKALLPSVSAMLLHQTASVLILGTLGPAALAIFTRPRSLLQQMDSLQRKMSMILTPTTSSLQSRGDMDEVRALLVKSVRYSVYLIAPMVLVLVVFGGQVMQLWMGPAYANGLLTAILALGFLGSAVQNPLASMLEGVNAHGWAGLAQLVASVVSIVASLLVLYYFDAGLVGMALAVTLPLLFVNLIYLPHQVCRLLGLGRWDFFRRALAEPVCSVLPFGLCLVAVRVLYRSEPVFAFLLAVAGAVTLVTLYWRSVLPAQIKNWVVLAREKIARVTLLQSRKAVRFLRIHG